MELVFCVLLAALLLAACAWIFALGDLRLERQWRRSAEASNDRLHARVRELEEGLKAQREAAFRLLYHTEESDP